MGVVLSYVTGAANHYWLSNSEKFHRRFGDSAEADAVYREYFSAYANNHVRLDTATLDRIDRIVQRKAVGREIGREWSRILLGEKQALDCSHRPIPNEPLLHKALNAQFTFERELAKLRTLNSYQKLLYEEAVPQVKLLKRLNPMFNFCGPRAFSVRDQKFISELEKKAVHYGITLKQQVSHSLAEKKAVVKELQARIKAVQNDRFTAREETWLNPRSPEMVSLRDESRGQGRYNVYVDQKLHPCLRNHSVVAIGDPILEGNAKFIIVKRPERMPRDVWWRLNSAENTESLIKDLGTMDLKPNKAVFIPFCDVPTKTRYLVEVCSEPAAQALRLHEDRNYQEKTRRDVVRVGEYARVNREEETGVMGFFKNELRKIFQNNWSEHREATAGPDAHEAIAIHRLMAAKVLSGKMGEIPMRVSQNLGEYFDSLAVSDVAGLEGSYMGDVAFSQALGFQKSIQTHARKFYESGALHSALSTNEEYSWKKDLARVAQLTHGIYESYAEWGRNLSQFVDELAKPKNKELVKLIGPETMENLKVLAESLRRFENEALPLEMRDLIDQRRAIFDRVQGQLTPLEIKERDDVWVAWRQNKTPKEIDRILKTAADSIAGWIKQFTPSMVKISVVCSPPRAQVKMETLIGDNLSLLNLYRKSIPPAWQYKAKIQDLVQGELMRGTELSPLWLKFAQVLSVASSELSKNEFIRSSLSKRNLTQ